VRLSNNWFCARCGRDIDSNDIAAGGYVFCSEDCRTKGKDPALPTVMAVRKHPFHYQPEQKICPFCLKPRSEPGRCKWSGAGPEIGPVHEADKPFVDWGRMRHFRSDRYDIRVHADPSVLTTGALLADFPKCPLCGLPAAVHVVRLQGFYDDGCRQLVVKMSCCGGFIDLDEDHVDKDETHVPTTKKLNDPVSHPAHYTFGKLEVIEVIEDWGWGFAFCLGNAVKYIARAGRKDPTKIREDLEKALWYLTRAIGSLPKSDT
jgi:uncharacterized protein DUF3310